MHPQLKIEMVEHRGLLMKVQWGRIFAAVWCTTYIHNDIKVYNRQWNGPLMRVTYLSDMIIYSDLKEHKSTFVLSKWLGKTQKIFICILTSLLYCFKSFNNWRSKPGIDLWYLIIIIDFCMNKIWYLIIDFP